MTIIALEPHAANLDADDYRPTAGPDFIPSDLDDAEWLGMSLRLSGEPMGELFGTTSTSLLLRFAIGQHLGLEIRQGEDRERATWEDERMEAAFGSPGLDWHPDEAVRAVGVMAARLS